MTRPGDAVCDSGIPLWLTILVISRDLAIVLTVAVVNLAIGRKTFVPSLLGKTSTGGLHRHLRDGAHGQLCGGGESVVSIAVILSARHHGPLRTALRRSRHPRHQFVARRPLVRALTELQIADYKLQITNCGMRQSREFRLTVNLQSSTPQTSLLKHSIVIVETVFDVHLRLPAQQSPGPRDVGLPHLRVVLRQRAKTILLLEPVIRTTSRRTA